MNLTALPAFSDNYIWMWDDGARALVVDSGDAARVETALEARGLQLAGILVTHHHADHVGGVDALRNRLQGPVFGPERERAVNPFLRCDVSQVAASARAHGAANDEPLAVFTALRRWKDQFR